MEGCRRRNSAPASAGPKLQRKDVEKNRRNYMKNLCNQLHSLLPADPTSTSKETTMAVQDTAVNYIENLKMKLEKNKKHLEELKMGPKKAQSLDANNEPGPSTKSPPQIEFHEMGQNTDVVLITGLDNIATFNNIIRLCHEEGVEVVATHFSLNGNSTLQISHESKVEMIKKSSTMEFRATTLCDKMKELIYGPISCNNDHMELESQLQYLCDYIIEFDALLDDQLLPTPTQNSNIQNVYQTPPNH